MEIAFESKKLRTICEQEISARKEFSSAVVETLQDRLADLDAAESIADLLVGNIRDIDYLDAQCKILDLADNHGIVFCSNHPKRHMASQKRVDWIKVARIKIVLIGKNDEQ